MQCLQGVGMEVKQFFLRFVAVIIVLSGLIACQTQKAVSHKEVAEDVEKKESDNPRIEFAYKLKNLLQQEKWEDALKLFDKLPPEEQEDLQIQNLKLSVLISANKIQDAEKLANLLEKENPENIDILFSQATLALATNNAKKRSEYLHKILKINPKNIVALTEQGYDLYSMRNYAKAKKVFLKALQEEPKHTGALLGLGQINYIENNLANAEKNYELILEKEPQNVMAMAELARIKSETNRMLEALNDMEKVVSLDAKNAEYWIDLGVYCSQAGRKERANEAFKKAVALDPQSYFAYIYLAGINDSLGNKEEAIKYYKKVIELYPKYYFAYESLGVLLFEKKDWNGAGRAFIEALSYAPQNCYYALMISLCYHKINNPVKAKEFMQKYIRTIDRTKNATEYFLCRLFVDMFGETDVYNRIMKEKMIEKRKRMMFYLGAFHEITGNRNIAEKYYLEVYSMQIPSFFEYRLAEANLALKKK
ncbi:tetratricopeptide repeat protein [Treponema phagedenis]|uniref:Tetratricopeptide repeat protein n=2 Tax=Treponema phagedenis TaxID=162 RepID=A0AAF1DBA5_TREPH|nr:tetratricopeptide repeat protein [Treponema phagedenis F0421]QEJ93833.1 tetratricopeptide repeat protein [Treponema phagedenis]QEJ96591.1 tetratricopeptide repeat protein [Treponema phagedenis]QEJ99758.1 tetratricopeptide repeat protein [Treponema phagedenis]QEK02377.1 tetratricopeptide repeat protein [Treponema phagedenis]